MSDSANPKKPLDNISEETMSEYYKGYGDAQNDAYRSDLDTIFHRLETRALTGARIDYSGIRAVKQKVDALVNRKMAQEACLIASKTLAIRDSKDLTEFGLWHMDRIERQVRIK